MSPSPFYKSTSLLSPRSCFCAWKSELRSWTLIFTPQLKCKPSPLNYNQCSAVSSCRDFTSRNSKHVFKTIPHFQVSLATEQKRQQRGLGVKGITGPGWVISAYMKFLLLWPHCSLWSLHLTCVLSFSSVCILTQAFSLQESVSTPRFSPYSFRVFTLLRTSELRVLSFPSVFPKSV